MGHKWFSTRELWDDLRTLEKSVGERYITHEAQEENWGRGGSTDDQLHLLSLDSPESYTDSADDSPEGV